MVLDLFKSGLFHDEKGKLNNRMRSRILDALGFGTWENVKDIEILHIKRAVKENMEIEPLKCLEVDDHEIHIAEHTKHILSESGNCSEKKLKELIKHVDEHKALKVQEQAHEALGGSLASVISQ
jgi:hypothetical protein